MNFFRSLLIFGGLFLSFQLSIARAVEEGCGPPILSRLQKHTIQKGETIASIAAKYVLIANTLIKLNPTVLKDGKAPVGKEILIPPMDGIRVKAPEGSSWKDLESAYGITSDILFEINGCTLRPGVVFIPGTNWPATSKRSDYLGLAGYPLPAIAKVGLGYGWQKERTEQKRLFHSGLDLLADVGTPVLAADDGLVVYVGQEGAYGYLVIINHLGNRQTRYAHLQTVQVKVDERVRTGEAIGTVGATGQPDIPASHLHFEVRLKTPVGWVAQDPMIHLRPEMGGMGKDF
jgi:murein DD-endopeptidase MepM/ murein hydrolase activator NlpD